MVALVQFNRPRQRCRPAGDGDDESSDAIPFRPSPAERDELPYRVELWDAAKTSVEQVLAVAADGSIGYAAYYAATREHPDRYITLRHNRRVVARWNGPAH
jgi:hypothetical protein